jgi:hypothetical protein
MWIVYRYLILIEVASFNNQIVLCYLFPCLCFDALRANIYIFTFFCKVGRMSARVVARSSIPSFLAKESALKKSESTLRSS